MSRRKASLEGPYEEYMKEYVDIRGALGYERKRYLYQISALNSFLVDVRGHDSVEITPEDYDAWVGLSESRKGKAARFGTICFFSSFLASKGVESVYCGDPKDYIGGREFVARILDNEEVAALFAASDGYRDVGNSVFDNGLLFPVLVRLMYGCGLRVSEACAIKTRDIDFSTGAISVINGKNGNSRVVYASDSLMAVISAYLSSIQAAEGEGFLLRGSDGRPYSPQVARRVMSVVRVEAGLEGGGKQSVRLHDLRHTFAVRAMEKMVDEGFDLYASLPYLSNFMGHTAIWPTEYYIRLAPQSFKRVVERMDAYGDGVYPDRGEAECQE